MDYAIKTKEVNGGSESLKGFATLNIGGVFKVTNIAICYSGDKDQYYIKMPSYRTNKTDENNQPVWKAFCCPANPEFYRELSGHVIDCFLNSDTRYLEVKDGQKLMPPVFTPEVRLFEGDDGRLKGFGSVNFADSFIVSNIRINQKQDGTLWLGMPSKKTGNMQGQKAEYEEVCFPVTKEFYAQINEAVLDTYQAQLHTKEKTVAQAGPARQDVPTHKRSTKR